MRLLQSSFALVWFCLPLYAAAQDAKLIEAAKKEGGKVVIYGSLETPVVDAVIAAFRKKTGLNAEYWRASAMSVMNRSMSEYRAGNPTLRCCAEQFRPAADHGERGDDRQVRFAYGKKVSEGPDQ